MKEDSYCYAFFSFGGRHKDGSVRLWLMFYDGITPSIIPCAYMTCTYFINELYCVYFTDKSSSSVASFELALIVYTAEYYEIPQGQQINVSVYDWLYSTFTFMYNTS